MNVNDYIGQALRSETPVERLVGDHTFTCLGLETMIAAAALADLFKKQLVYAKAIDREKFLDAFDRVADCARLGVLYGKCEVNEALAFQPRLTHAALGGFGEYGELLEALLINGDDGTPLDMINVAEEIGDVQWYQAVAMDEVQEINGVTADDILTANIEKLRVRYPDKFTVDASDNRCVDAERVSLEGSL